MMSKFAWTVSEHYDYMHMQTSSDECQVVIVMDLHDDNDANWANSTHLSLNGGVGGKTFTLRYWSSVDSVRATIHDLDFVTALRYAEQLLNGEMEYRMVPKEDA